MNSVHTPFAYHLSNRLCINILYPCTFISCAQVRLEWLSSQQRTRTFYGEHRQLAQVTILVTLLRESLQCRLWKDKTIHLLTKIDVTINFDEKNLVIMPHNLDDTLQKVIYRKIRMKQGYCVYNNEIGTQLYCFKNIIFISFASYNCKMCFIQYKSIFERNRFV